MKKQWSIPLKPCNCALINYSNSNLLGIIFFFPIKTEFPSCRKLSDGEVEVVGPWCSFVHSLPLALATAFRLQNS